MKYKCAISFLILLAMPLTTLAVSGKKKPSVSIKDTTYWQRLGDASYRKGKLKKAKEYYEKALQTAKNSNDRIRVHQLLARISSQMGNPNAAITHLKEALKDIPPKDMRYLPTIRMLAEMYVKAGAPEKARTLIEKTLEKTENLQNALMLWGNLCRIFKSQGKLDELIETTREKVKKDPSLRNLLMLRTAYVHAGRRDLQMKILRRIAKEYPEYRHAQDELAQMLISSGKADEAVKVLERLVKRPDANKDRYASMLVEQYLKLGDERNARRWIDFLKRPRTQTCLRVVSLLEKSGKYKWALRELDEAIENAGSPYEMYRARMEKIRLLAGLKKKEELQKEIDAVNRMPNVPAWVKRQIEAITKQTAGKSDGKRKETTQAHGKKGK